MDTFILILFVIAGAVCIYQIIAHSLWLVARRWGIRTMIAADLILTEIFFFCLIFAGWYIIAILYLYPMVRSYEKWKKICDAEREIANIDKKLAETEAGSKDKDKDRRRIP